MTEESKPVPNPSHWMTEDEKAVARRAELYHTHKVRGSLGTFYRMFPDLAPPPRPRDRDESGRER